MSTWGTVVLFAFNIVVLLPNQSRADEQMQKLVLETKRNKCHEISVLRIAKLKKPEAFADGEEDKGDSGNTHDLSATRKFHDAAFPDKLLNLKSWSTT
jgi:hypothetical protein